MKQMKGKGWKTHVWENLGWHYSVRNGTLEVYANEYEDGALYDAMISDSGHGGNRCWTRPRGTMRKDPNKAAELAVKRARKQLNKCLKVVEAAEKTLGIEPKKEVER